MENSTSRYASYVVIVSNVEATRCISDADLRRRGPFPRFGREFGCERSEHFARDAFHGSTDGAFVFSELLVGNGPLAVVDDVVDAEAGRARVEALAVFRRAGCKGVSCMYEGYNRGGYLHNIKSNSLTMTGPQTVMAMICP